VTFPAPTTPAGPVAQFGRAMTVLFCWATVAATFALGTAAGDLTATTLGLGYLASGSCSRGLPRFPVFCTASRG
jgi:hypothetical protein